MLPKTKNALVVLLVMIIAMTIGTLTTIDMGDQPQAQQTDRARDALLRSSSSSWVGGFEGSAQRSGTVSLTCAEIHAAKCKKLHSSFVGLGCF